MLNGKTVLLGVTGSIAAYKMANVASLLIKQHCNVHVLMTNNATNFISPITFESLTGNKCYVNTFDRNTPVRIAHIELAKRADLMLIAPTSANVIAKLAYGIADDMLTTAALACTCKKLIAPAMNTNMYHNKIVQHNLQLLQDYNFSIISPTSGRLACGSLGEGKMADEDILLNHILAELAFDKDMKGLNVLVTAGPTQEPLDPVRFITNHSSGKMGYAIARIAMLRGAHVTLISGKTSLEPPQFLTFIPVSSAEEMFHAVTNHLDKQNVIIKAAAVSDFCPVAVCEHKIKKKDNITSLPLKQTTDILKYIGEHRTGKQYICGFSMETQHLIEHSKEKMQEKKIDMMVANNINEAFAGFQVDTNIVTIITKNKELPLELMSKDQVAEHILTNILKELS